MYNEFNNILINYIISLSSQVIVKFSGYPKEFYDNTVHNKLSMWLSCFCPFIIFALLFYILSLFSECN